MQYQSHSCTVVFLVTHPRCTQGLGGGELELRHNRRTDNNGLSDVSILFSLVMYLLDLICIERIDTNIISYFGKYYFVIVKITKRFISNKHKNDKM